METTKETLEEMYNFMDGLYKSEEIPDIYWIKRMYNEFCWKFWLDIDFGVDWCEYWWDDSIYCYVYVNNIWSIVFNRWVNRYTDNKSTVNHLLELQKEAEDIRKRLEQV